jgi:hypothetical protein
LAAPLTFAARPLRAARRERGTVVNPSHIGFARIAIVGRLECRLRQQTARRNSLADRARVAAEPLLRSGPVDSFAVRVISDGYRGETVRDANARLSSPSSYEETELCCSARSGALRERVCHARTRRLRSTALRVRVRGSSPAIGPGRPWRRRRASPSEQNVRHATHREFSPHGRRSVAVRMPSNSDVHGGVRRSRAVQHARTRGQPRSALITTLPIVQPPQAASQLP